MTHKIALFSCDKNIQEHIEDLNIKFIPDQRIYMVNQKRKRVSVIESQIDSISLCKSIGDVEPYNWYVRYHIKGVGSVYWNDDQNIFKDKEDAYEYAEKLSRRKDIKFKSVW